MRQSTLLHYQGHAQHLKESPLESSLQLADGPFTAMDVARLQGIDASLVALASCQSAVHVVNAGDEPLGLVSAFLCAGARSVLATQWKVHGPSVASFTKDFYSVLQQIPAEVNRARALQDAAMTLRARHPEPYFWAPFVLYGLWL